MAEYGSFLRDRENLERQIARTSDPVERRRLELRKEIESADYMAITSERIAGQSEIIVGKMNSPEAVRQRERAKEFQEQSKALRQEYRELSGSREQGKGSSPEKEPIPQEPPREPVADRQEGHKTPPLKVEERTVGKPRGPEQNLGDFIKTLPDKPAKREFTKEELRTNPEAKRANIRQQTEEKNRALALDSIARDLKYGKNLNTNDIRRLSRDDLEGIKRNGDHHLKSIVQAHEQTKERDRGLER
jgi:hypothetical protein